MAAQRVTIRAARHHDVRPSSWHDRNIEFRPFGPRDQPAILGLLSGLSTIYPDSAGWLRRRLTDTLEHRARCTVAVLDDVPVAVLIESPKGPTEIKLSTLYVAPEYRRLGIATHSLHLPGRDGCAMAWIACTSRWIAGEAILSIASSAPRVL